MRNPITGDVTQDIRNILTEDLRFVDGTIVRMVYEDGQFSGITVYAAGFLGKEYSTDRGAQRCVAQRSANVLRNSDLMKLHEKLMDRVQAGELAQGYAEFVDERENIRGLNAKVQAEYDAAGYETSTLHGAVVRVIERTERMTTLGFFDGTTVPIVTSLFENGLNN